MLKIGSVAAGNCAGITRRELIQVGGAALVGLALPEVLRADGARVPRREKSCIFLWLDGGPSHFETFDPKPESPIGQRGPYGWIDTSIPGERFSELVPMLAERANRCTIIRSMSHSVDGHSPVPMMTGDPRSTTSHGAVITYLMRQSGAMPPYVHLGKRLPIGGGVLGGSCNPVSVEDPTGSKVQLPDFSFPAGVNPVRFDRRRKLLAAVDDFRRQADGSRSMGEMDAYYQRALALLTTSEVRDAFDLAKEPTAVRERYGCNFFGQSCLLARRLVEAGTRFVQVKWYDGPAWNGWDVHGADTGGLVRMEQHLCPRLDLGLSALLDDLQQRGLLDTTLVVALGEFGRTGLNRLGGRDHWPFCFSALLAGGGAPAGLVLGASDGLGMYPTSRPVSPADFSATLYRLMGLNPTTEDRLRPFVAGGAAVAEIAGTG
jgi:hypothetical protein